MKLSNRPWAPAAGWELVKYEAEATSYAAHMISWQNFLARHLEVLLRALRALPLVI